MAGGQEAEFVLKLKEPRNNSKLLTASPGGGVDVIVRAVLELPSGYVAGISPAHICVSLNGGIVYEQPLLQAYAETRAPLNVEYMQHGVAAGTHELSVFVRDQQLGNHLSTSPVVQFAVHGIDAIIIYMIKFRAFYRFGFWY